MQNNEVYDWETNEDFNEEVEVPNPDEQLDVNPYKEDPLRSSRVRNGVRLFAGIVGLYGLTKVGIRLELPPESSTGALDDSVIAANLFCYLQGMQLLLRRKN